MNRSLALALGLAALAVPLHAQAAPPASASASPLAGTEKLDGLYPVHVDRKGGRILLSLPAAGGDGVVARMLYATALRTGLGSAPIGLDRAAPGPAQMLLVRRMGKKIAFELEKPRFRASAGTPAEQAAAANAFATSLIWMGDAVDGPDGRLLVDIAPFLARDTRNVTVVTFGLTLHSDVSEYDEAATKAQLWGDLLRHDPAESVRHSMALLRDMATGPDFAEGSRALSERRPPEF